MHIVYNCELDITQITDKMEFWFFHYEKVRYF